MITIFTRLIGATMILLLVGLTACVDAANAVLPRFDKVVVVVEENKQESTIIGNPAAPYINWLASNGALFTNSHGVEHPSQPNYLNLFSGSNQNIYSDAPIIDNPFSGDNLAAELLHHGYTFVGFSEDLPYTGDTFDWFASDPASPPRTPDYARKHNPWANWQNDAYPASVSNKGSNYLPSSVNQTLKPFTAIRKARAFDRLPTVSFVIPNQEHDGHGVAGGLIGKNLIAASDSWLWNNISAYAAWAKTHNSLLIVTWDEADNDPGNSVATIFYGDHVLTGQYAERTLTTYTSLINSGLHPRGAPIYSSVPGINHWNVLRTIEDMYQLHHCGETVKVYPVTDVFTTF